MFVEFNLRLEAVGRKRHVRGEPDFGANDVG